MILIKGYVVVGKSMLPTISSGSLVFVSSLLPIRKGHIVLVKDPRDGKKLLKRVQNIIDDKIFVIGDNAEESTDSRTFGPVPYASILGRMIMHIDNLW